LIEAKALLRYGGNMDRRVCAIVGAGEGLGQSLAAAFAAKGFDIALSSRSENGSGKAADAARRANPAAKVAFFAASASEPQTLEAALGRARRELGDIEVLIYNVRGDLRPKPPLEIEYQELRAILDLEVVGALAAAKAVIPAMIEKGRGTVIFSSATAAFRGSATNPLYAIAKFGARGLAQSLAKAYAKAGVHVAHVRLDCALDVPVVRKIMGPKFDPDKTASTDDVASTYLWIVDQPKSAWSNEVELRPFTEEWTY
jgi:NAD(P)-dependent dehydrogenase (short-subunit alcohol dehydrogenase family)